MPASELLRIAFRKEVLNQVTLIGSCWDDHPAERDTPGLGPLDAVGGQDANGVLNQIHRNVRRSIRE